LSITLIHGASCCFASPTGYHTNLMIQSVGGYRCRDFITLGLPLNLFCSIVVASLVYGIYG
jgi:di/tricarboxylate transporter